MPPQQSLLSGIDGQSKGTDSSVLFVGSVTTLRAGQQLQREITDLRASVTSMLQQLLQFTQAKQSASSNNTTNHLINHVESINESIQRTGSCVDAYTRATEVLFRSSAVRSFPRTSGPAMSALLSSSTFSSISSSACDMILEHVLPNPDTSTNKLPLRTGTTTGRDKKRKHHSTMLSFLAVENAVIAASRLPTEGGSKTMSRQSECVRVVLAVFEEMYCRGPSTDVMQVPFTSDTHFACQISSAMPDVAIKNVASQHGDGAAVFTKKSEEFVNALADQAPDGSFKWASEVRVQLQGVLCAAIAFELPVTWSAFPTVVSVAVFGADELEQCRAWGESRYKVFQQVSEHGTDAMQVVNVARVLACL